ncbi:MAG: DUF1993 domain-containing protein [Ottowia sp.]|nr:DUF1993 domain-containing protein [Ottowia sp.]
MYIACVPVFKQMLGSLNTILGKAQSHCVAKKIEPSALLMARLFPDMFPLYRQVHIACDFARGVSARLANHDVPSNDDKEQSFEELQALVEKTLRFIEILAPSQFEGSETREIITRAGTPKEKRFTGQQYLLAYGLPQFFFHITTVYGLLRHAGVEIGKRDYMGV